MARVEKIVVRSLWALFIGFFVLVFASVCLRSWWVDRQIEAKLAALRAAGQPVSLEDLERTPPPDERNAATYLLRAHADMLKLGTEIEVRRQAERDRNGGHDPNEYAIFDPAERESMTRLFAPYSAMLRLLEQAADCDDFDLRIHYEVSSEGVWPLSSFGGDFHQVVRSAARTLEDWALLEASHERPDHGLARCGDALRLARLYGRQPEIICRLVSGAIRYEALHVANSILQTKPTSFAARDALRKDADFGDPAAILRATIAKERVFGLAWLRASSPVEPLRHKQFSLLHDDVYSFLDIMGIYWDDAQHAPDLAKSLARGQVAGAGNHFLSIFLPRIDIWEQAEVRSLAETRCLLALLKALDEPKLAEKPEPSIDDLALPASVSIDPFTGGKLTLRKVPRGWLVYAVGDDMKDDGGQVAEREEAGESIEPADTGFAPPPMTTTTATAAE